MGYISAQQAATKWGISKRRVQVLCTENRIKNATRIGNMWVVPEDALKPADGRVQTHHTVESPTARAARTALKKLTVNAYQEINGKLNNPSTSKMVFVSLLATTIFCDIQNDESSNEKDDVFLMISSELLEIEFKESSRRSFWEMFSSLVSDFEKYIYRYADYVDDILSWAYQYVNKLSLDSGLESTQFFTEEYMIEYLTKGIPRTTTASSVYLDPACGGGNFLSHILNQLFVLRYREIPKHPLLKVSLVGELNTYAMFAELASRLTEKDGFAAIIVKSALVTSTCYSSCFRHFVNQGSLSEVFLFDNREKLFQIDSREKFCVLFFGGEHAGGIKVHYGLTKQEQILSSVPINVTSEELELINPETGLLPNVADSKEFSFLLRTHRSLSVFAKEFPKCHFGRLVHLTAHAEHISTKSEKTRVPIYEGKFIEQYDNRFSTFAGMSADERYQAKASARRQPGDSFVAPKPAPECRYFIDKKFWESFLDRYDQPYSLCWRSLTSPTNQRTMIASIIPSMPTCQSVQLLQTTPVEDLLMILALFNSKVFDFFVRLKMGGIDLTQSVVRQIPVPFREAWNSMVTLHGVDYTALDAVRALERLLYRNEPDLCGLWDGVPEIKNADNYYKTAADVREEIDKIIFQMYGLTSAEEKMVRNSFKA